MTVTVQFPYSQLAFEFSKLSHFSRSEICITILNLDMFICYTFKWKSDLFHFLLLFAFHSEDYFFFYFLENCHALIIGSWNVLFSVNNLLPVPKWNSIKILKHTLNFSRIDEGYEYWSCFILLSSTLCVKMCVRHQRIDLHEFLCKITANMIGWFVT